MWLLRVQFGMIVCLHGLLPGRCIRLCSLAFDRSSSPSFQRRIENEKNAPFLESTPKLMNRSGRNALHGRCCVDNYSPCHPTSLKRTACRLWLGQTMAFRLVRSSRFIQNRFRSHFDKFSRRAFDNARSVQCDTMLVSEWARAD